jgi:putative membrane protein
VLTRDALLAFGHFICIFALASLLVAEFAIVRAELPADLFRRLRLIDNWYGITAGLVVATGLSRLFFGLKGAAFYTYNPVFWTKMALLVIVAVLSIPPTIAYIRWNSRKTVDGSIRLEASELGRVRGYLRAQMIVFLFIPLCATFMARGL